MLHIIMDLLSFAVIALCAFLGWRKGFFRSLVNTLGSIFLYLIAYFGSKTVAPILYEKFWAPYFLERIELYITNVGDGVRMESVIINALNKIPKFCRNLLLHNTNTEVFIKDVSAQANHRISEVGQLLVYDYIPEVLIPLIQGVLFILMLLLLFFLLRSIILLLGNHAAKRTLIGRIDCIIGSVCGIFLGIILLLVFAFAIQLIIGFSSNELPWCNTEVIEQSFIFRWIYSLVESGMVISV